MNISFPALLKFLTVPLLAFCACSLQTRADSELLAFPDPLGSLVNFTPLDVAADASQPAISSAPSPQAPHLAITGRGKPQLTISASAGSRCQIQYTSGLGGNTSWLVLTNVDSDGTAFTWVDSKAPGSGNRFYRVVLVSNAGSDYASSQLVPGEIYRFTSNSAGMTNVETLVVNSATSGLLIQEGLATGSAISEVTLQYRKMGPLAAEVKATWWMDSMKLMAWTNTYLLVFTSRNEGSSQKTTGPGMSSLGKFSRDQSMVGQTLAPAQLTPGETYRLMTTSAGMTNSVTLLVNSANNGLLLRKGAPPESGLSEVILQYRLLGPFAAQVEVAWSSADMGFMRRTNTYLLVFTTFSGGPMQVTTDPAISQAGQFIRDLGMVGQEIASERLTAGETYQFTVNNAGITNVTTLVINSASSALLIREGMFPESGISEVSLQYRKLGPFAAEVKAVWPTDMMDPMGRTNSYLLAFTSSSGGDFETTGEPAMTQSGQFARSQGMVGQDVAPSQLAAGESYQFTSSSAGITSMETLVVNTAGSALFIRAGSMPESGISEVALQYRKLGPLSAEIKATWPIDMMNPMGRTNTYLLVFTSSRGGGFEKTSDPAMTQTGQFTRDQSMAGQEVAPALLTVGETYRFTTSSAGMTNLETLLVNSAGSALLIREGSFPESGISEVSVQFRKLGPLSAEIKAIWPIDMMNPMGRTNTYLLVFTSSSGGGFEKTGEAAMTQTGQFTRDQSMVGQAVAPAQLSSGETYLFASTSAGINNLETLIVNSASNGLLVREGTMPDSGINEVTLHYQQLGPLTSKINLLWLASAAEPAGRTNTYLLIFTSPGGGSFQKSSDPAFTQMGSFKRTTP